ncbi:MAG TPA: peroxidase-related enzyme [Urbifossiella sp.]|jgi:uncharacterized peroxidase-related enzyme|nr:peroxidase-related enzyme [Urbifossiella sp.]
MPHIQLPGEPGIIGLLTAYRASEKPLNDLANAVMRGPSSLTAAERELISAHVSNGNECYFCTNSHAAATRHLYGEKAPVVDQVLTDLDTADLGEKMKALLVIAGKVRRDGRTVTEADVQRARAAGADDQAVHDTVLIAAMFCMFNRYVDGLATVAPRDPAVYDVIGKRIATKGYGSTFRDTAKTS